MRADMVNITRLRNAIAETEAWALAASQTRQPGTPTGEHWHWKCSGCDTTITVNPVTDAYIECPNGCPGTVALRSVEEYPSSVGPLSARIVSYAEEVSAMGGALIARHDPAAVLRRCAADRKLVDLCEEANSYAESREWFQNDIIALMLEAYGIGSPE